MDLVSGGASGGRDACLFGETPTSAGRGAGSTPSGCDMCGRAPVVVEV